MKPAPAPLLTHGPACVGTTRKIPAESEGLLAACAFFPNDGSQVNQVAARDASTGNTPPARLPPVPYESKPCTSASIKGADRPTEMPEAPASLHLPCVGTTRTHAHFAGFQVSSGADWNLNRLLRYPPGTCSAPQKKLPPVSLRHKGELLFLISVIPCCVFL